MFLNWIVKILKAINANQRPGEIAAAVAIAWHLALMPAGSGMWWLIFLISFFLRINSGVQAVALVVFNLFTFLFDPFLHSLGFALLSAPFLQDFWLGLWNTPPFAMLGFQNTLVLGGFMAGVLLWVPVFILSEKLVTAYREKFREAFTNHPLVKGFFQLPLIKTLAEAYNKSTRIMDNL